MLFNLPNPIPFTPVDEKHIQDFFLENDIVPYYSTTEATSHAFLDLLCTLCELSPSFGSVERDLKAFTFGLNADIVGKVLPGIDTETIEIAPEAKADYVNFLSNLNINVKNIIKKIRAVDSHLLRCANAYLHIKRVDVGETVQYYFNVPHFKHCAYVRSRDLGERFIVVSPHLGNKADMLRYPPLILRASQADEMIRWNKTGSGIEEAIIHVKAGTEGGESDYYNRPEILSVLTWLYVDFQAGNLASKISATEIISKKIIAFMAPNPETQERDEDDLAGEVNGYGVIGGTPLTRFQQNMLVLKELTTNLATHPSLLAGQRRTSSIAGIEYPYSEQGVAPTTIDLEVNRDTNYQTFSTDKATAAINAVLGWAPELTGLRKAASNLGGNLIYDMFTIKNESTIQPRQVFFDDLMNNILAQIVDREGGQRFAGYGLELPDVISGMVEKFSPGSQPGTAVASTVPNANINSLDDEE